jgi:hypothetical protein
MAFGQSRQAAFLARAAAHEDEPDYEPGLRLVQQLIADAAKAKDLVKRAVDATATIKSAKAAVDELESARRKAEDGIVAAKAEAAALLGKHQKWEAGKRAEIEKELLAAKELREAAERDLAKAASDMALARKRLAAVEAAVNS